MRTSFFYGKFIYFRMAPWSHHLQW